MVTTLQRFVFTKCHLQCRTLSRLKFPYLQIISLAQENTYLKVQLSLRIKPRNVQLHNFIEDQPSLRKANPFLYITARKRNLGGGVEIRKEASVEHASTGEASLT